MDVQLCAGFLSTLDDRTPHIASKPLFGNPLNESLTEGIKIRNLSLQQLSKATFGALVYLHTD